jgi:hypothetical protein
VPALHKEPNGLKLVLRPNHNLHKLVLHPTPNPTTLPKLVCTGQGQQKLILCTSPKQVLLCTSPKQVLLCTSPKQVLRATHSKQITRTNSSPLKPVLCNFNLRINVTPNILRSSRIHSYHKLETHHVKSISPTTKHHSHNLFNRLMALRVTRKW